MFKKIIVLILVVSVCGGIFYACSSSDDSKVNPISDGSQLRETDAGLDLLISLNNYGIKSFKIITIDANNLQYDVEFGNGSKNAFYCETTTTTKRIYEITGLKREIVFDNTSETIEFFEDGIISDPSVTNFQDLAIVVAAGISDGNLSHIEYPVSVERCIHTAISIRWRKSLTVSNVQAIIDNYIAGHPDCTQLGGIDSYCQVGDFGCASVGEISCATSGCN